MSVIGEILPDPLGRAERLSWNDAAVGGIMAICAPAPLPP